MDAITALRTRRSIRRFTPTPVPREMLETLVDCGRHAATGRGVQPWEFIVITRRETLDRLAELTEYGKFLAQAPVAIVVFCADTKYYLEDGSAAVQNLLVAAIALGLGSCWIAGDKKPYADDIRALLGAPEGYMLIATVALGFPDEHPHRVKRPLADVLHWEQF